MIRFLSKQMSKPSYMIRLNPLLTKISGVSEQMILITHFVAILCHLLLSN